jgi:LPS O-antigen subunit length determinant protein (WzzB/FepE family)
MDEIRLRISDADLLYQALQLRDSLDSSQGSSSRDDATSTAFMLIKLKSYTTIPNGVQMSTGSAAPVSKADIDDLVRQLEDRSGIHDKSANQVLQEKNTLTAQLEQEKQQSDEMLISRDAALNAYLAAVKNAQTINIQRNSMIAPIRIVSYATTPQSPISSNRWTNIGIALVLGLILGVIAAFIAEYVEKRRPAHPAKQTADNKPQQ